MLAKSFPILLLGLAQLTGAQTTTSSAPSGRGTDLPQLVKDVDPCVLGCVSKVANQVNCNSADLKCLCSKNPTQFRSVLEPCIGEDGCDFFQALASIDKIGRVCDAVKDDPEPTALASASQVLDDITSSETAKPKDEDEPGAASGLVANGLLAAAVALLLV